jgi:AcrR family transcriptional regulator
MTPGESPDQAANATPHAGATTGGATGDAPDDTPRAERRIRGRTLAERREERRDAMLAAGLDLFGTKGYAATTVEEVCRRAYVSSRNFYEEFDNRLGLLVAVGERIVAAAFASWTAIGGPGDAGAGTLRRRVGLLVHTLVDDPRVTRVAFIETVGIDPAHEALRRQMLGVFPAWLQAYMQGHLDALGVSPRRQRSLAIGLFGAAHELITDWALQPPDDRPSVDDLIDDIVELGVVVLQLRTSPAAGQVAPGRGAASRAEPGHGNAGDGAAGRSGPGRAVGAGPGLGDQAQAG